METVNASILNVTSLAAEFRARIWNNRTNRMALLFLLAAIFFSFFLWTQVARRHYTLSANSQRIHNSQLKSKLEELTQLNNTLKYLRNIDQKTVTS